MARLSSFRTPCASVVALMALLLVLADAHNPGLKISLSQGMIDKAKDTALAILLPQLKDIKIDDMSGKTSSPIGKIDYKVEDVKLDSLDAGTTDINLQSKGIAASLSKMSAKGSLGWKYSCWVAKDHGTADIKVEDLSASFTLGISDDSEKPSITVSDVSVHIDKVDFKLHGGTSWLYNLFTGALQGTIKDSAEKAIKDALSHTLVDQGNAYLQQLPVDEKIDDTSSIDVGLASNPEFTSSEITTAHVGEFMANAAGQPETPGEPGDLPDPSLGKDLEVAVSEWILFSAGWVYFNAGKLESMITPSDVPSSVPIKLNTGSFCLVIPDLCKQYPGTDMQIDVLSTEAPQPSFTAQGLGLTAKGNLTAYVLPANGDPVPVFTLTIVAQFAGQASLTGMAIVGKVDLLSFDVQLAASSVGQFDAHGLSDAVNILLKDAVVPFANKALSKGFPIPAIPYVQISNPVLQWGQGFLLVGTDATYSPPSWAYQNEGTRLDQATSRWMKQQEREKLAIQD